jgi:hypothetical protein
MRDNPDCADAAVVREYGGAVDLVGIGPNDLENAPRGPLPYEDYQAGRGTAQRAIGDEPAALSRGREFLPQTCRRNTRHGSCLLGVQDTIKAPSCPSFMRQ